MFQYTNWQCGDCERSFCIAIDDDKDSKNGDIPVCPRCGGSSVIQEVDAESPTQDTQRANAQPPSGCAPS